MEVLRERCAAARTGDFLETDPLCPFVPPMDGLGMTAATDLGDEGHRTHDEQWRQVPLDLGDKDPAA